MWNLFVKRGHVKKKLSLVDSFIEIEGLFIYLWRGKKMENIWNIYLFMKRQEKEGEFIKSQEKWYIF